MDSESPQGRAAPSPPPAGAKETRGGPAFPCEAGHRETPGPAAAGLLPRRRFLYGGVVSGAMLAAGVSSCGGGGWDDDARLRGVNASLDVASIDLRFNDWLFGAALGIGGGAGSYAARQLWSAGGVGRFDVFRAGSTTALLRTTHALPQGDTASVVVTGSLGTGLRLRILGEDAARPGGQWTRLRVLHAWLGVGPLDVFVTLADATLAGRAPDWVLGAYDELSPFSVLALGTRLRVTPRGQPAAVLFDNPATGFAADRVATLVLAPVPGASRAAVAVLAHNAPGYVLANHVVAPA
jgi:hypothetical protein